PLPDPRAAKGLFHLVLAGLGASEADVVADARREQVRLLARDRDRPADILLSVVAEITAGHRHAAALRVEEAEQEVGDGRLAGAAWSEERDPLTGSQHQAHSVHGEP